MKPYNLRFLLGTSLLFCLFQAPIAEEDTRYYDVELVVFENLQATTGTNELWPPAKRLAIPDNSAILGRRFEGKLPPEFSSQVLFTLLAQKDYRLNNEVENIKAATGQFRLLLHTGWRQPGLAKEDAVSVYFNHAIAELATDGEETTDQPLVPARLPAGLGIKPATDGEAPTLPKALKSTANLQGLITIVLSRYLHLDAELVYSKEPSSESVDMFDSEFLEDRRGKDSVFYLQHNRRMRSKETHYIDHPRFGMLVRITPYEGSIARVPVAKPQTPASQPAAGAKPAAKPAR